MRVSTRLVAIVLIPVLGLLGFSAREATARWRVTTGAEALAEDADRVSTLTPVALMVAREMYLRGAIVSGRELGIDPAVLGEILGLDLEQSLSHARTEVDRRLGLLDADDAAQPLVADLAVMRTELDTGAVELQSSGIWDVSAALSQSAFEALQAAQDRAIALVASRRTQRSLEAVDASYDAASAVFAQIGALGKMAVADDDGSLLQELLEATVHLDDAHAELERVVEGPLADRVTAVMASDAVRSGADAVGSVLAAGDLETSDPAALARLFGTAMERLDAYYSLVVDAADVAASDARSLGAEARQRAVMALAVTVLLLVATVAATALIARSIGRPLRRLTSSAAQVRAGVLDEVDLPTRGPREIVAVTRTLREVVDNLQVVEAQLAALHAGQLDEPVLAQPVPGRIGESLHGSVARLSRSLQEREELAARLEHEATHDPLTGLPNRSAASRELGRALARARRTGVGVAVLYIDLDDFKKVNDNHGHDAGDRVLQVVAERLLATLRAGDFVARLGGDEFLVITEDVREPRSVLELGLRIVDDLGQSIPLGSVTTRVGASIGISLSCDLETDGDELLRDADRAAYEAKANGRGRVQIFDAVLRATIDHQADIEDALRRALHAGELTLHFQPMVRATDGAVTAVEALIRWNRPGEGLVMPGEFIPVAETSDLIIDVGRWVLDAACAQVAAWTGDPVFDGVPIAVNLSGRHVLNLTVVDDVHAALRRHGVAADRLIVEVTETTLVTDLPLVGEHLARLRAMGVRVSLDDFGTGYTSLSHLRSLPVDVLKIDRSLVVSGAEAPDLHILRLLVGTAHALGIELVAEGVETREQLDRVSALACDQVQGYLIGRPGPASALRDALMGIRV